MTDLTDKWKKGELPDGHYYVKDGENIIAELFDGYFYNDGQPMTSFSGGVDEVLAPVPSYEEYLALQSDSLAKNEFDNEIDELNDTIDKLKELLKEAYPVIDYADGAARSPWEKNWLAKADEVLK